MVINRALWILRKITEKMESRMFVDCWLEDCIHNVTYKMGDTGKGTGQKCKTLLPIWERNSVLVSNSQLGLELRRDIQIWGTAACNWCFENRFVKVGGDHSPWRAWEHGRKRQEKTPGKTDPGEREESSVQECETCRQPTAASRDCGVAHVEV